jgi:uncharacterized protein (DUF488 family)
MVSAVWTIGYRGTHLEHLIEALVKAGVDTVIDTRANPYSPRPEFRKGPLGRSLVAAGIMYRSMPDVGAPRDIRSLVHGGPFEAAYRTHLAAAKASVGDLVHRARLGRVCLLCAEDDPAECHRSLLAEEICRQVASEVIHLRPARPSRLRRTVFLAATATDADIEDAVTALLRSAGDLSDTEEVRQSWRATRPADPPSDADG